MPSTKKRPKEAKSQRNNTKTRMKKLVEPQPSDKKKSSKKNESWARYIYKVFREIHSIDTTFSLSIKTMTILCNFMEDMFQTIAHEAELLVRHGNRKTLLARDIQTAVKLLLPGELGIHALSEGQRALQLYLNSTNEE